MGDDWPDLPLIARAAFACAPPQAHAEVRASAHHVTAAAGGYGAARECCDLLLCAAGRYADLLAGHLTTLDGSCGTSVLEPLEALGAASAPPAGATTRWTALPWRARVLDSLSSYLPLLLMGLLALGSWWLVKNTPLADGPRAAQPRATNPTTRCTGSRSSASTRRERCGQGSKATRCATSRTPTRSRSSSRGSGPTLWTAA